MTLISKRKPVQTQAVLPHLPEDTILRNSPAATMATSCIGGDGIWDTAFVTTAAASGPRDIDLAFPIKYREIERCDVNLLGGYG